MNNQRTRLRKLPVPFAAEELLEGGTCGRRSAPFVHLSDGWYCYTARAYKGHLQTFFVWKGGLYQTPPEFGVREWFFELGCYEHIETCGRKYPHLRREVEERRDVNRMLLQLEKFIEQQEEEETL